MAKMDPNAADAALAVWNGTVQDARRHAQLHISDAPSSNRAGWQRRAPLSSCQKQVVFMYVFLCIFSRSASDGSRTA
jgi:hypothetical protein